MTFFGRAKSALPLYATPLNTRCFEGAKLDVLPGAKFFDLERGDGREVFRYFPGFAFWPCKKTPKFRGGVNVDGRKLMILQFKNNGGSAFIYTTWA